MAPDFNIKCLRQIPQIQPNYFSTKNWDREIFFLKNVRERSNLLAPNLELYLRAMMWHNEYDSILHIINKKTGEPHPLSRKIKSRGYICFHYPNAYEEDGHIVMDATV